VAEPDSRADDDSEDLPPARDAFNADREEYSSTPSIASRAGTLLTFTADGEPESSSAEEAAEILQIEPMELGAIARSEFADALMDVGGPAEAPGRVLAEEPARDDAAFLAWAEEQPDDIMWDSSETWGPVVEQQQASATALFRDGERRRDESVRLIASSLVDQHPLVRVGAAAALLRHDGGNPLAFAILRQALGRTREVAIVASTLLTHRGPDDVTLLHAEGDPPPEGFPEPAFPDSTIVHGTWAREGDWWRPNGEFHHFLRHEGIFPALYGGGDPFEWSGFFSYRMHFLGGPVDWDRLQAGGYLAWWAERELTRPPHLIGHSYGGSLAMCATRVKKEVRGLILLSPAIHETCLPDPNYYGRALLATTRFDLVLVSDRSHYRLLSGMPRVDLRRIRRTGLTGHPTTHSPRAWRRNKLDQYVRDDWLPRL
jgi:Alpha/beta hydrolase family